MKVSVQFRQAKNNQERGVTMVLVAIAVVAIVAMAAMSIDLVTLYLAREQAQHAADAGALAAARIISVSGITGTASPTRNTADWRAMCGAASGWATQAAQAAAAQNSVGAQPAVVSVTYTDGTNTVNDCSTLSDTFAVNPMVTVQVLPVHIPSFFSRIWGKTGNDISASATAEAFNPSQSNTNGIVPGTSVTPVQPRCVKPWIVPNLDPRHCTTGPPCDSFVALADGSITHPGISPSGVGTGGVIGERLTLTADCTAPGGPCTLRNPSPQATSPDNLQYLPGSVQSASQAVPGCASSGSNYEMAVAGCDQTTSYQCGQVVSSGGSPNMVDLSENPYGPAGDTAMGLACSLTNGNTIPLSGQDGLRTGGPNPYPFVALAGDANPLAISGSPITASNSIMSLPIYDQATPIKSTGTTNVTIIGFLQVFVKDVLATDGSIDVYVLNVAGCGNVATNPAVLGSSPIPVRLITPH